MHPVSLEPPACTCGHYSGQYGRRAVRTSRTQSSRAQDEELSCSCLRDAYRPVVCPMMHVVRCPVHVAGEHSEQSGSEDEELPIPGDQLDAAGGGWAQSMQVAVLGGTRGWTCDAPCLPVAFGCRGLRRQDARPAQALGDYYGPKREYENP